MKDNPAYRIWRDMHGRCRYPSQTSWKWYGGRGIEVCTEWATFAQFWADMGPTYQPGLTIERKNNDEGYTFENCTWISRKDQASNQRANRVLETPWGCLTHAKTARQAGINDSTLRARLARGMSVAEAVSKPVRGRKT